MIRWACCFKHKHSASKCYGWVQFVFDHVLSLGNHQPIVFNKIILDEGNSYSNNTCIKTSSVHPVLLFVKLNPTIYVYNVTVETVTFLMVHNTCNTWQSYSDKHIKHSLYLFLLQASSAPRYSVSTLFSWCVTARRFREWVRLWPGSQLKHKCVHVVWRLNIGLARLSWIFQNLSA